MTSNINATETSDRITDVDTQYVSRQDIENLTTLSEGSIASIDEMELRNRREIKNRMSEPYLKLCNYIDTKEFNTESGDPKTNIFIPKGSCYNISNGSLKRFFDLLDECRKDKLHLHYAEKQQEYSGMMIDLDINHYEMTNQINDMSLQDIVNTITDVIAESIDLQQDVETYVGVLKADAPRLKYDNSGSFYRESIHILIPGIKISKILKQFILKQVSELSSFRDIFKNLSISSDVIDMGSANVPVHFIGSCKQDTSKIPDLLKKMYKVIFRPLRSSRVLDATSLLDLQTYSIVGRNTCWEFSLNYQVDINPFIEKKNYEPHPSIADELQTVIIQRDTDRELHGELSCLGVHDSNSVIIKKLLGILNLERASNYQEWRKVLYILASQAVDYKPLAIWFSQRVPEKWNPVEFEKLWADCLEKSKHEGKNILLVHYISGPSKIMLKIL